MRTNCIAYAAMSGVGYLFTVLQKALFIWIFVECKKYLFYAVGAIKTDSFGVCFLLVGAIIGGLEGATAPQARENCSSGAILAPGQRKKRPRAPRGAQACSVLSGESPYLHQ